MNKKYFPPYFLAPLLIGILLVIGCSVPPLKLNHTHNTSKKYSKYGAIKVIPFKDNRPESQKQKSGPYLHKEWILLSGKTDSPVHEYFTKAISEEIKNSGMFDLSDSPDYKLGGYINSMKVKNWSTPLYAGTVSKNEMTSEITLYPILKKGDKTIYKSQINIKKEKTFKINGFSNTAKAVSDSASVFLDHIISLGISQMLNELEGKLASLDNIISTDSIGPDNLIQKIDSTTSIKKLEE